MDSRILSKIKDMGWRKIILLAILLFLFALFAPVVPWIAPGGATNGTVGVFASISYVLTHQGVTYWQGQFFWDSPPVV